MYRTTRGKDGQTCFCRARKVFFQIRYKDGKKIILLNKDGKSDWYEDYLVVERKQVEKARLEWGDISRKLIEKGWYGVRVVSRVQFEKEGIKWEEVASKLIKAGAVRIDDDFLKLPRRMLLHIGQFFEKEMQNDRDLLKCEKIIEKANTEYMYLEGKLDSLYKSSEALESLNLKLDWEHIQHMPTSSNAVVWFTDLQIQQWESNGYEVEELDEDMGEDIRSSFYLYDVFLHKSGGILDEMLRGIPIAFKFIFKGSDTVCRHYVFKNMEKVMKEMHDPNRREDQIHKLINELNLSQKMTCIIAELLWLLLILLGGCLLLPVIAIYVIWGLMCGISRFFQPFKW